MEKVHEEAKVAFTQGTDLHTTDEDQKPFLDKNLLDFKLMPF